MSHEQQTSNTEEADLSLYHICYKEAHTDNDNLSSKNTVARKGLFNEKIGSWSTCCKYCVFTQYIIFFKHWIKFCIMISPQLPITEHFCTFPNLRTIT